MTFPPSFLVYHPLIDTGILTEEIHHYCNDLEYWWCYKPLSLLSCETLHDFTALGFCGKGFKFTTGYWTGFFYFVACNVWEWLDHVFCSKVLHIPEGKWIDWSSLLYCNWENVIYKKSCLFGWFFFMFSFDFFCHNIIILFLWLGWVKEVRTHLFFYYAYKDILIYHSSFPK